MTKFINIPVTSRFVESSQTIVIKNILLYDHMENEADFVELEEDMREELSKYG